jgi:anti-sigma regulatory factor (Ser/Thr protein kinase)
MNAPATYRERFDPEALSVRSARAFVVASAGADEATAARLELLVSEIASNAVLHARTPFVVEVACLPDGGVRVSVSDDSTDLPIARKVPLDATTGRGLLIVDSLADSWGVVESPGGKTVWFEIAGEEAGAP